MTTVQVRGQASLDLYARMVRRSIGTPTALVTLVEPQRQVFVGAVGLPAPYQETRETPLSHSFCQHVVSSEVPLVVTDAREVDHLADNLAIVDLDVVAYAGWPLRDHTGSVVGSLCATDSTPRTWTADELDSLRDIAEACSAELAERGRRDEAERTAERGRALLALSEALTSTVTMADIARAIDQVSREQLGAQRAGIWLLDDPGGLHQDPPGAVLSLVSQPGHEWAAAERFSSLPVEASNPLGAALLGRRPISFPDRDSQDVHFPAAAGDARVAQARAIMPLELVGRPLGVLVVAWATSRSFDEEDDRTLAALAAYTAQAVQRAALLQDRVEVSVTLQRAMLTHLPEVAGLAMGARYLPAARREQVGGDWYDAIHLPSGAVLLAVGDVVGHDIAAAAVMGQLRSMLRGIVSTVEESPARSLTRLDHATARLGINTMASALLVRLEPAPDDTWRLTWSSAGHPPHVVVDAEGAPGALDLGAGDPLLGVDHTVPRRDHHAVLAAGSVLFMYTDGLVERRGEVIDAGLERLGSSLARHHRESVEVLPDLVLGDLVGPGVDDDVAVLAVRLGE